MKNEENNQLQIELGEEVAEGIYVNFAVIAHASSEFVLDFVRVMPGLPKAGVKSRVVLAPEHAKRLWYALGDNLAKYEQHFGNIKLPEEPLMAPIVGSKGDA